MALNESVKPLDDVRVRKALQLALKRTTILDAIYSGRGTVENGIDPHGLYGFNPELPEIPYDPDEAKALLEQAGFPDGFELTLSVNASSTGWDKSLLELVSSMWKKIGVNATVEILPESEFMSLCKSGQILNCCHPNALMTLAEFLVDYASPATRETGWPLIQRELEKIPKDEVRRICAEHIEQIRTSNSRDFRF